MSLGVTVGFAIAYPINVWLVAKQMKHGLMTVRASTEKDAAKKKAPGADRRGRKTKAVMKHTAHGGSHSEHVDVAAMDGGEHGGEMGVTRAQLVALTGFTLLMLCAGMFGPAAFVNLRLSAEEVRSAIMPPGKWIFHCHIPHHTLNNNVEVRGAGGLTLLVDVTR